MNSFLKLPRGKALTTRSRCSDEYSIVSYANNVDQNARVSEIDFRAHVLWNTGRSMKGDRLPDQIGISFGNTVTSEEFARSVSAIHLESLRIRMVSVD